MNNKYTLWDTLGMNLAHYMLYSLKTVVIFHPCFPATPATSATPGPVPKMAVVERFECMTTLTAIDPLRENFRKYAKFFLFLPELLVSVNENT